LGVDGIDGAPKLLLLLFALAAGIDGAPKFEFGAESCLAKYLLEGEEEGLVGGAPPLFCPCMYDSNESA
jgi:hypothetical protein